MTAKSPGLYANIHAKQERIEHGSGEKMRKPGAAGAPSADAFEKAKKTEKSSPSGKAKAGTKTKPRSTAKRSG